MKNLIIVLLIIIILSACHADHYRDYTIVTNISKINDSYSYNHGQFTSTNVYHIGDTIYFSNKKYVKK